MDSASDVCDYPMRGHTKSYTDCVNCRSTVELLFFDRANFQNPIDIKKLTPTIRKKGGLH